MARNTQTDFPVDFEPARRSEEAEAGWFERVGGREDDPAVVDAVFEGGRGGRTAEGEVPFEEVGLEGRGGVVEGGLLGEFTGFFEDAFDGWVFGGELAGG